MDASVLSDALASAVESSGPSVVRIEGRCAGASGTVWSADGVVVTTNHSLGRGDDLSVALADGRTLSATVAGRDPSSDVAVLRIAATDLTPARWSDGEGLKVGHLVLPLGRPGRSVRATMGIVSALGDSFRTPTGATFDRYIEVDANLPRGFSGGPLVDAKGAALGVNTGGVMRGGATIPTVTLRRVVTELLTKGHVGRGYLGVSVYPARLPDALAATLGKSHAVVIVGVERESPAEAGGLKVGDVIASIDGVSIDGPGELMSALDGRAGAEVVVKFVRADQVSELKVTAGSRR
jgi:S1-C subfamily serine protease